MPLEKALEIASHITHPNSVAAFAAVLALITFIYTPRAKRIKFFLPLAVVLLILGTSPIIASAIVSIRGIYHVRITVLGLDGHP